MTPSKENQLATKQMLSDLSALLTRDGAIYLKHLDGTFGYIADENLLSGDYIIIVRGSWDEMIFDSVDALIAGGWTID